MGNSQKKVQDYFVIQSFHRQQWMNKQGLPYCQIWQNKKTQLLAQAYEIPSQSLDTEQLDNYELRNDHDRDIVKVLHVAVENNQNLCSKAGKAYVLTQRIPYRLNEVSDLTQVEALTVLESVYRGFNTMSSLNGPIEPFEDMIGFNEEGKPKVWLNSNLSTNKPNSMPQNNVTTSPMERNQTYIHKIFKMVEARCTGKQLPIPLTQKFQQTKPSMFLKAVNLVQDFAQERSMEVPACIRSRNKPSTPNLSRMTSQQAMIPIQPSFMRSTHSQPVFHPPRVNIALQNPQPPMTISQKPLLFSFNPNPHTSLQPRQQITQQKIVHKQNEDNKFAHFQSHDEKQSDRFEALQRNEESSGENQNVDDQKEEQYEHEEENYNTRGQNAQNQELYIREEVPRQIELEQHQLEEVEHASLDIVHQSQQPQQQYYSQYPQYHQYQQQYNQEEQYANVQQEQQDQQQQQRQNQSNGQKQQTEQQYYEKQQQEYYQQQKQYYQQKQEQYYEQQEPQCYEKEQEQHETQYAKQGQQESITPELHEEKSGAIPENASYQKIEQYIRNKFKDYISQKQEPNNLQQMAQYVEKKYINIKDSYLGGGEEEPNGQILDVKMMEKSLDQKYKSSKQSNPYKESIDQINVQTLEENLIRFEESRIGNKFSLSDVSKIQSMDERLSNLQSKPSISKPDVKCYQSEYYYEPPKPKPSTTRYSSRLLAIDQKYDKYVNRAQPPKMPPRRSQRSLDRVDELKLRDSYKENKQWNKKSEQNIESSRLGTGKFYEYQSQRSQEKSRQPLSYQDLRKFIWS